LPRKAPKDVIEHRVTFGDYERAKLDTLVDAYNRDKYLENIPSMMLGVAGLGAAAVFGVIGYALYYWFDSVPSMKEVIRDISGAGLVKTAVTNVSSSVLSNMTRQELEAIFQKDRDQLQTVRDNATTLMNSKSSMQRIMGEKLLAALPAAEEKLAEKHAKMLEAWQNAQVENQSTE